MKPCPQCRSELLRYRPLTLAAGLSLAIECETCGYVGPHVPLARMNDPQAAVSAVRAWDGRPGAFLIHASSMVH